MNELLVALANALHDLRDDPRLKPLLSEVEKRGKAPASPNEWRRLIAEAIADEIARGWDRYGAPGVARNPEGKGWIASAEAPGGPIVVHGHSKREAYRTARELWITALLYGPQQATEKKPEGADATGQEPLSRE